MKNVLVTGGCGFIGANFIRYLLKNHQEYNIFNLDKLTYASNKDNLIEFEDEKNYHLIEGDICDGDLIDERLRKYSIDTIVNFAAESHVDKSNLKQSIDKFRTTNVFGVHVLLDYAIKNNIEKFLQISTDEVYGSISEGSFREEDNLNPSNPYSVSKKDAEDIVLQRSKDISVLITRSSNNFGPYQYPEKFLSLMITNLLLDKKIPIYGDGKQVRDWLYVEDNCDAIYFILTHGKSGEIYNISTKNEMENINIARKVLRLLEKNESSIEHVGDRENHDRRYSIDNSKITKLGWNHNGNLDSQLEKTVDWYLHNMEWWEKIRSRPEFVKWYYEHYTQARGLK